MHFIITLKIQLKYIFFKFQTSLQKILSVSNTNTNFLNAQCMFFTLSLAVDIWYASHTTERRQQQQTKVQGEINDETTWHFATLPNNTVGQQNNIIKNLFKILFAATIVPRCISYWVAWRATLSGRTYRRTMRSSVSTIHSPRSFCSPAVWSLRPLSMLASRSVALWMEYPLMWSTPSAGSTVLLPCRMRSIDR